MTGKLAMRQINGALVPADRYSSDALKARKLGPSDVVFATLRKPRNPKFHRLAHALGQMLVENLDDFEGMDSHAALKRLQLEAGVACESIAYKINGMSIVQSIPLSLSFESMDQSEFESVFMGICRHLAKAYWPSATADEIAAMADVMPAEAG